MKRTLKSAFGAVLQRLNFPAVIRPFAYDDPVTGQKLRLSVSSGFSRLNVNGRDYFFVRADGSLDGTGCGCSAR